MNTNGIGQIFSLLSGVPVISPRLSACVTHVDSYVSSRGQWVQHKSTRKQEKLWIIKPCTNAAMCQNWAWTGPMLEASVWFWPSPGTLQHAWWEWVLTLSGISWYGLSPVSSRCQSPWWSGTPVWGSLCHSSASASASAPHVCWCQGSKREMPALRGAHMPAMHHVVGWAGLLSLNTTGPAHCLSPPVTEGTQGYFPTGYSCSILIQIP